MNDKFQIAHPVATCPHCGGQLLINEEPAVTVEALRRWCQKNGHVIYPIDRVRPETAAAIMGINVTTIRNRRSLGLPPTYIKASRGRSVSYSLEALATYFYTTDTD